jgi:hypothetical protein
MKESLRHPNLSRSSQCIPCNLSIPRGNLSKLQWLALPQSEDISQSQCSLRVVIRSLPSSRNSTRSNVFAREARPRRAESDAPRPRTPQPRLQGREDDCEELSPAPGRRAWPGRRFATSQHLPSSRNSTSAVSPSPAASRRRLVYAFCFTLSYSRALYVEFVDHQDLRTVLWEHQEA